MRIRLFPAALSLLITMGAATAARQTTPAPEGPYRPTATIKDIMLTMIDPSADYLWESVSTTISEKGLSTREPRTDMDWLAVRQRAVTLVEATNLLLIPGRRVAKPGEKSENPGIELEAAEIEALIAKNRASWTDLSHGLHDASTRILEAIEAHDVQRMTDLGAILDHACENCHLKFWYPNEARGGGRAER